MSVILGIDIGGSTTKIVGLREDQSVLGMQRVKAEGPVTSLYGALGTPRFLYDFQSARFRNMKHWLDL